MTLMERRRGLMAAKPSGDGIVLPPEYQRVAWIGRDSPGPCIKVTDSAIGQTSDIIIVLENTGALGNANVYFAGRFAYGDSSYDWSLYLDNNGDVRTTDHAQIVSITRKGSILTVTARPSVEPGNKDLFFFSRNRSDQKFIGRIYTAVVTDAGVTRHVFVPCYRKADTVIGMYDVISNRFFDNFNSTYAQYAGVNFVKGDNV